MTTITNNDGDTVTRISVMQLVTYDVAGIVQVIQEDNDDELEITLDDVLRYVSIMAEDDFGNTAGLIYQDQDGNNL
jgi:hypothetical protein